MNNTLNSIVNIVNYLPKGSDYIAQMNTLTSNANFATYQERVDVLQELVNSVGSNAIDGFVKYKLKQRNPDRIAEDIWRTQMQDAEVQSIVRNVSYPRGGRQYQDNRRQTSSPEQSEETYCLLGIVLTTTEDDTQKFLDYRNLTALPSMLKPRSLFRYWFGPITTGVSLTEAQRLFSKLSRIYK